MLPLLSELCEKGNNVTINAWHIGLGVNETLTFNPGDHSYREITFDTIWINLEVNLTLCILQLVLFWICLWCKPALFAPKMECKPPVCPLGWVALVWQETAMGKGKSARHIAKRLKNLDGAIMVRFCVLGFKWSLAASVWGAFLLPWYRHSPGRSDKEEAFTEYNINNMVGKDGPNRFWPCILAAYALTLFFAHLSIDEWCNYDIMRKEHFTRLALGKMEQERKGAAQAQRSVLVELVPREYRLVNGEAVARFFQKLFPHDGVHSAVVQAETAELHGKADAVLMYEGKKTLRNLRKALDWQLQQGEEDRRAQRRRISESPANEGDSDPDTVPALERTYTLSRAVSPPSREGAAAGHGTPVRSPMQRSKSPAASPMSIMSTPNNWQMPREDASVSSGESRRPGQVLTEAVQDTLGVGGAVLGHGRNVAEGVMQRAHQAAQLLQDITLAHDGGVNVGSSTAFVTFHTVSDRMAAEQIVLSQSNMSALNSQGWYVRDAPEAADIIWANAAVPHARSWVWRGVVRCLLLVAMLFWMVPITLITIWTQIDQLKKTFPFLQELEAHTYGQVVYTLLKSYLPVLAQMGLLYALPPLLETLGKRVEGEKTKSRIQISVVGRYLAFLFVTIYSTILQNSLLSSFCKILAEPSSIFDILRAEVPSVACYFITYVMARAGLSAPMLLLFAIISAWEPRDERERLLIRPNYAMEASNLVLVLVLGMTYCVIAPMVSFACMVYFALTSLIYSFLFLYVYTPEYDCHGGMWHNMFQGSMWGLLFGVASLTGLASSYVGAKSLSFFFCLLLLLFIIVLMVFFQAFYALPSQYIPLEVAREIDSTCYGKTEGLFSADYYVDPVITGKSKGLLSADAGLCFCCRRRKVQASRSDMDSEASEEEEEEDEEAQEALTGAAAAGSSQEDSLGENDWSSDSDDADSSESTPRPGRLGRVCCASTRE